MHTKSAIFFTVLMVSGVGCESASDTASEDSTLAALGVDLRDPAVRAEWEAKCAADADVADVPEGVSDAGAIDSDGDDDVDEVAEESAGGGDRDRTDKICRFLDGGWGGRGHHGRGRGDHDRGHDERGDDDGRFDERECDEDGGFDEDDDDQGDEDDDDQGDEDDDTDEGGGPLDAGAPEAP